MDLVATQNFRSADRLLANPPPQTVGEHPEAGRGATWRACFCSARFRADRWYFNTWEKEPNLSSECVLGYGTSANYGYSWRQSIAYGYRPLEYATEGWKVDICFFVQRHKATVMHERFFDSKSLRLKM